MSNHPNRGGENRSRNPGSAELTALREHCGLTQAAAAALVHSSESAWQQWEAGDRRMHPAMWELFRRKVGVYSTQRTS